MAETLIGVYKMVVIRKRGKRSPWHHREPVTFATLGSVDGFNWRRLLEPLGDGPPAEKGESVLPTLACVAFGSLT